MRTEIYGLIYLLKNYIPPKYQYLPSWHGETLKDEVCIVNFYNSVKSSAYILPGVNPSSNNVLHEGSWEFIHDNLWEDEYFLIISSLSD